MSAHGPNNLSSSPGQPRQTNSDQPPRRGGHPSRQKRFGPAPLASFEDLPTDDQDSSPENNDPLAGRSRKGDQVGGTGTNCTLRLDLLDTSARVGEFGGHRADSELSTPVAPESDVISQITITPTADSRNVSPCPGALGEFALQDPLVAAGLPTACAGRAVTRSSLTTSVTEDSSFRDDEEDAMDRPEGGLTSGQIGVTQATIEICHDDGSQLEVYGSCSESLKDEAEGSSCDPAGDSVTVSHTAITSEAILESLLKFEEERIPLAARLERSCQSIADIPSASHSRKNSSTLQQAQSPLAEQPTEAFPGREDFATGAEPGPSQDDASPRRNEGDRSDPESAADNAPTTDYDGKADRDLDVDDDDEVADLSSSAAAGPAATRRRRRKLRPQTSEDRFESLRLLPAQDSLDVDEDFDPDEDPDHELQALSGHRGSGPEFQIDDFCTEDPTADGAEGGLPKTPARQLSVVPAAQRQQLVTIPIERPRSTTPINVAPFEAYVQQQGESCGGQNGSEKGATGPRSPDRLKLTLPGQSVGGNAARSPRKGSLRNWEEFCEEALQHSPRARSKSDAAALGQRFFPDPLDFSPASPPRLPADATDDDIQSPSDFQDPFRRRLTCSCRCSACSCLCGGCDCDCHFYTQKVFESHLNDPMSRIAEINGTPGSPREDEQSLLSPDDATTQGPCLCECHSLPRDTSCLLTAPLLVGQSSLDSC